MTSHDTESLDPLTWLDRITRLFDGLRHGEASPERHIRAAYHLVKLAPAMVSQALPEPVDEATLEALLADANYESAVMTLVGPSVRMPPVSDGQGSSSERARALLHTWAGSFLGSRVQPA